MDNVMAIVIIMFWIAGMVAIFISPEMAYMLWAFPAGHGGGTAIVTLIRSKHGK